MSAGYTWGDIAEKYATHIRAYVHKFTRLGAYKDDVVQDTLIRLKVLLDQGRLPDDLDEVSGLCIDIARIYSLNQMRKMERLNRVGSTTDDGVVPDKPVEPEEKDLDHNKTNAEILDDLISKLPTKIGQVLRLRRDGLTMTSIASRLGCTKNAVDKLGRKAVTKTSRFSRWLMASRSTSPVWSQNLTRRYTPVFGRGYPRRLRSQRGLRLASRTAATIAVSCSTR